LAGVAQVIELLQQLEPTMVSFRNGWGVQLIKNSLGENV
jgi:hypothetical protein